MLVNWQPKAAIPPATVRGSLAGGWKDQRATPGHRITPLAEAAGFTLDFRGDHVPPVTKCVPKGTLGRPLGVDQYTVESLTPMTGVRLDGGLGFGCAESSDDPRRRQSLPQIADCLTSHFDEAEYGPLLLTLVVQCCSPLKILTDPSKCF